MTKQRGAPRKSVATRVVRVTIQSSRELEGVRHYLQIVHDGYDLSEWILANTRYRGMDLVEWVFLLREAAAKLEQQYRPVMSMGPRHTRKAFKMATDDE